MLLLLCLLADDQPINVELDLFEVSLSAACYRERKQCKRKIH